MTKYECYWCSNLDWVEFDRKKGMTLRKDAPQKAQDSYKLYLKQREEHRKRLKEYIRMGKVG